MRILFGCVCVSVALGKELRANALAIDKQQCNEDNKKKINKKKTEKWCTDNNIYFNEVLARKRD